MQLPETLRKILESTWIRIAVGVVIAVAGMIVWYQRPLGTQDLFGSSTGAIIVDTPGVYSRERLVNDRFREATWLDKQLESTDDLSFDVEGAYAFRDTAERTVAATVSSERTDAAHDVGVTNGSGSDPVASTPQGTGQVHASPVEVLKDKMAYREEVRAASMETQLDDRHDIAGNTLYRIKFGATVLPEHDTSAWAMIYVRLRHSPDDSHAPPTFAQIYHDWLEHYQNQLNQELDKLMDGLKTNAIDVAAFARLSAFVNCRIVQELCRRTPDECPGAVSDTNLHCLEGDPSDAIVDEAAVRMRRELEPFEKDAEQRFVDDLPNRQAFCADSAKQGYTGCIVETDRTRFCTVESAPGQECRFQVNRVQRLTAAINVYKKLSTEDTRHPSDAAAFTNRMAAEYLLDKLQAKVEARALGEVWRVNIRQCEIGLCRFVLEPTLNGEDKLEAELENGAQVFSYAVTPKESVQRIAGLSDLQRRKEILLAARMTAATLAPGNAGATLGQKDEIERRLNTILRKPVVVGFADSDSSRVRKQTEATAAFGWVIGPRLESVAEGGPRFRHVAVQNDLSAVISVPSWWRWAQVEVSTCWVDEREVGDLRALRQGFRSYRNCKYRGRRYNIQLPGNQAEIARKLGLDVVRRPLVEAPPWNVQVRACGPADFIIRGTNLWRSTVVALGSQVADRIAVLPDMRGIVAHFESVDPELAYEPPKLDPKYPRLIGAVPAAQLSVWTSEGSDLAATVIVLPPDNEWMSEPNQKQQAHGDVQTTAHVRRLDEDRVRRCLAAAHRANDATQTAVASNVLRLPQVTASAK